MAEKRQGVAGENLLRICESRLDNVVYLLGWASSRAEARQLVIHAHFRVNGKKVDVPSYLLKVGDVVSVKDNSKDSVKIKEVLEAGAKAALEGAASTVEMKANFGRARNYGERSIGFADSGATSWSCMFESFAQAL